VASGLGPAAAPARPTAKQANKKARAIPGLSWGDGVRRQGASPELLSYVILHPHLRGTADHPGRASKAIQAHLGHSSIQVTMDRYGHLFPDALEQLTDCLDAARAAAGTDPARTEPQHEVVGLPARQMGPDLRGEGGGVTEGTRTPALRDHNLNLPTALSQLLEPKGPRPVVPPNRGRPLVTAHARARPL
jgi:hypothetical protein